MTILSPLLSNVVLDELDKELESRGLEFCRFADDCNIFVRSQVAAERVMQSISKFIENRLKLVVNREKSKVDMSIRGTSLNMEQTIEKINSWYVGWASYYSMTQYPYQLSTIEAHVRRRLRARIVAQQKKKRHLVAKLVERGIKRKTAAGTVYSNKGRWALSYSWALRNAFNNHWFIHRMGQKIVSDRRLPNWFNPDTKVNFT